jgi:hypothetical protein
MPLDFVYSSFKKKKFEEGRVYIVTGGSQLIEAKVYGSMIVNVKSRALSHDQIADALLADDVSKVNESPESVKLEEVQPDTIKKLFRAAAPFVFDPDDAKPSRLFNILKIMAQLAKIGGEGNEAFDIISSEFFVKYASFSIDRADIKKRIANFTGGISGSDAFTNINAIPTNTRSIPDWVFSNITVNEPVLREMVLYSIFFGEMFQPLVNAIVKKEVGLSAKNGVCRMSKIHYKNMTANNTVTIYKGSVKTNDFTIAWHADNKSEVMITNADLERSGIRDGVEVGMLFSKK